MSRWDDDFRFPASRPIAAKGGIKAGTQRGAFGKSWWAKRWIAVLESFNIGGRLGRGRSYARSGQVLKVEIEKGHVSASVQGSRPQPYRVSIDTKIIPDADWKKVGRELGSQAIYAAKLLGGEMPDDIEQVFEKVAVPLFPEKLRDLKTNCSCPDSLNPCKHIAAVYYLLGEEFDRDPFLLFRMRGLDRKELVELLGSSGTTRPEAEESQPVFEAEPLPLDLVAFWQGGPILEGLLGSAMAPVVAAALPKRLGNFPFWRGERPFIDVLEGVYRQASAHAGSLLTEAAEAAALE